jgi:hypothetical protein
MTRYANPLRRSHAALPGNSLRDADAARWAGLAELEGHVVRSGNFFHRRRAKTPVDESEAPTGTAWPGRLNLFQATMLDWREFHPYNAVHAARLARPLDDGALAQAIETELRDAGLTGLVLDRQRCRYAWRGGPAHVVLETIEAGADWQASLARAFERHLNAPFPREGAIDPFRFFVMRVDSAFFLGVAYDHFIAGGDSIIALLDAIAARYAGKRPDAKPLRLYPRTHAHLFARHPLHFALGLARLPRLAQSCRRTIRPRYRNVEDGHNGFAFCWLEPPQYRALRDAAKAWGVTLNDALMALLLLAQDAAMPRRDMTKRRHELAVASIINLRSAHGEDPRTFGQFLSSFRVAHPVPHGTTLDAVARDVHRATRRIKREKLYLTTLFAMGVDRLLGRLQKPSQRMGIYAKNYPVGAGVSSLNVDGIWQSGDGEAPLYVRGVPTGPLSPIAVAVTTSGARMCIGISYRTTALSAADADALRNDLVSRIDQLQ